MGLEVGGYYAAGLPEEVALGRERGDLAGVHMRWLKEGDKLNDTPRTNETRTRSAMTRIHSVLHNRCAVGKVLLFCFASMLLNDGMEVPFLLLQQKKASLESRTISLDMKNDREI